jgi:hypothetical protein
VIKNGVISEKSARNFVQDCTFVNEALKMTLLNDCNKQALSIDENPIFYDVILY